MFHVVLLLLAVAFMVSLAAILYLAAAIRWLRGETGEDRYFKRPVAERIELREAIADRARRVVPLMRSISRVFKPSIAVEFRGTSFPAAACPYEQVKEAVAYAPDRRDIFVVTQMKCGTTWMQQIVYEVLMRGRGDLGDDGHHHMYALSPWIEARTSVSMENAPRIGDCEQRIIKSHLPVPLCPWSTDARYVYVLRHPVACFASSVDFVRMLFGPIAPSLEGFVDWFCSDAMWWGPWPDHADGWWRRAQEQENVLFLHYEEMLEDLGGAVDRVASHLGVSLSPEERAAVVDKSGYDYMKAHEDLFEMTPPTFFSVESGSSYFVSGKGDRHRDAGDAERERILRYCRERLAGASYPVENYYPDISGS